MATVFRGVYRPTGMPVAIKVLNSDSSDDEVLAYRFQQEARIQNILGRHHPAIVTCYEPIEVDGRPAMVLEYVPGQALSDILDDDELFSPAEAIDIAVQVLSALAYAHHHGVIHRDIKSDNILLTPEGQVKIADFGVARAEIGAAHHRLTEARDLVGTIVYMAPEQLTSPRTVDHRADLYSLGITLYELVTGEVPFDGEEGYPLMKRIEMEEPADPRTLEADLPSCLAEIILRAIHKEPDDRYYSAPEMTAALLRCREELTEEGPRRSNVPPIGDPGGFQPSEPQPLPEPRSFGWLEDLSGRLVPGRILIRRAGMKLGRHPDRCDIVIPDETVALEHALVLPLESGEVLLIDLNTDPGTTLGDDPVTRRPLVSEDEFVLAGRWSFRFCR